MPPIEEGQVRIPESITINGVTYIVKDTPELLQFVNSVAQVEKKKLYSQFESLKNQIQSLGATQIQGNGLDMDALVNKLKESFVSKDDLKETLPNIVKEVMQPVLAATEQSHRNELAEYREKLIQENAATCIPDLVKGNSKEELDASLAESIRLRGAYPPPNSGAPIVDNVLRQFNEKDYTPHMQHVHPQNPVFSSVGNNSAPQNVNPQNQVPPMTPRRPSPEISGQPTNTKSMSMSEFSQKRESLLNELQSLYGGSAL